MLLRALMFRLAVHALHPRSTAAAFPGSGAHRGTGAPDPVGVTASERVPHLAQRDAAVVASTPSARSSSSWRVSRCGAGRPDALITRCHGRSDESVRMIHATIRGLGSPAASAMSP